MGEFSRDIASTQQRVWGDRPRPGAILSLSIVTPTEILLQPHVGTDKEVATAHLLDLQLRLAVFPVLPGNWHYGPSIAPHNGLQGDLDGQIEMRGQKGAAALDHCPA